ncbi:MAG: methyltransferase domain-containing protein [Okeania sp. SIO2G4]|uniref:class I SAM-dependent DNA methyltransferase n=1 Tax=unclassified Okeania TaxID=2634635 RepID=UPI0013B82E9C|nr:MULTISPECIES: class I SAM-dependent methyltransferase [unclassified Okeania]NEP40244.1 methyltransferase domain-containing protein [Okeania sp. SIO2H7]NEP71590.1 methyltransferase domain-containing protein [Okeania sp. SIO2G5]NEP92562.1 methyltransferase domain-containing protein [Okeania sp. SIO2F5]NEQ90024.1 methyltransferase domain-containing protein [Okeania sp. SIO2G4]
MSQYINITDYYDSFTDYYDLLMTQGYYDYQGMANAVYSLMKDGHKKILELGVGTGLFAEKLLPLAPEAEFTGVDITLSMLEIARKRLGGWGKLLEADIYDMNLQETFDIAVSSRGVWVISQRGDRTDLRNHTKDIDEDIKGLINVAKHLHQDGLFLLSFQGEHKSYQQSLPTGIVYSHEIEKIGENYEIESIDKTYFFKKDGEILAQ